MIRTKVVTTMQGEFVVTIDNIQHTLTEWDFNHFAAQILERMQAQHRVKERIARESLEMTDENCPDGFVRMRRKAKT